MTAQDIRNVDTTKYVINADYIAGLIESDGCFVISIDAKTTFRVQVSISSLTNSNTLQLIKEWLNERGINCCIDIFIAPLCVPINQRIKGTLCSRSNLSINGNKQVERFLKVLKGEVTSEFLFCGVKQRDYLLVCAFFKIKKDKRSPETQDQMLAIKKSMHKSNYLDKDSVAFNINTYQELKERLSLSNQTDFSSSYSSYSSYSSSGILIEVDYQYSLHILSIQKGIIENKLNVSRSFIAGVVDGDGLFYITVSWKEPNKSYSKRHIHWEGCFTLSTDKNSSLLFDLLKFVFKLPPIIQVKALKTPSTKHITGVTGSYQMWIRNQAQMIFVLQYLSGYLCGNYRILQYKSVSKLFNMRLAGSLKNEIKNVKGMKDILSEIYIISAISKKGSLRSPVTLEEALAKTDLWFTSYLTTPYLDKRPNLC